MKKGLLLYILVFVMLLLSYVITFLEILSPLGLVILLIGVVILWRLDQQNLTDLGFVRHQYLVRWLVLGLIVGLVIPFLFILIQTSIGWLTLELQEVSVPLFMTGIVRIVLIVLMEEVVFRGFFLQKFEVLGQDWIAITISSMLWSFLHIPNMLHSGLDLGSIVIGMGSFIVLGLALGYAFLKTGKNLWLPIGIHLGYNTSFSVIGALFQSTVVELPLIVGQPPWVPESGIVGVLLASAILLTILLLQTIYVEKLD